MGLDVTRPKTNTPSVLENLSKVKLAKTWKVFRLGPENSRRELHHFRSSPLNNPRLQNPLSHYGPHVSGTPDKIRTSDAVFNFSSWDYAYGYQSALIDQSVLVENDRSVDECSTWEEISFDINRIISRIESY